MTATLVLPGTAPETDWLAARRYGITASEIPVLMGLSPWSSPYALYHRKTGNLPDGQDQNDRMDLGHHLESYIVKRFWRQHPEFCVSGDGNDLYAHPGRPWQLATPDRLIQDGPTSGVTELDDGTRAVLEFVRSRPD